MDQSALLLCKYGIFTYVINALRGLKYEEFINMLCCKWGVLKPGSVFVSFKFDDHPYCIVDNDCDFDNMLRLVFARGLEAVDVLINGTSVASVDSEIDSICSGTSEVEGDRIVDIERNSCSKYCAHEEKVSLSSSWANSIRAVGQKFEGGAAEFRTVLCKYAVEVGFEFRYVKNDKVRVTAECAHKVSKGCMWRVHCSVESSNNFFYIRTLNNEHTCGVAVRTCENCRMGSKLVADLIVDKVRDKPLTRPVDVVKEMKSNYGQEISYYRGWLGVEKAKDKIYGDHSLSFDRLRWYFDEALVNNPGSRFELDFDTSSGRFKRVFVAFNGSIVGFNFCRPMLFLDGTFLKGRYKGTLLAATGKDRNEGFFPVAFAIVDAENKDNWFWFLQQLKEILSSDRAITFISDRNWGLIEAIPLIFPTGFHSFCLEHLKRNVKDHFSTGYTSGFRDQMVLKFTECAYAPTKAAFHYKLDQLKSDGGDTMVNFLRGCPYENWADSYFKGHRYGEMYSNVAESFNAWIVEARYLPITNLVDMIRLKMMTLMDNRRVIGSRWSKHLCPNMDRILEGQFQSGRNWKVSSSSENVFEVHSLPSVIVDISCRRCSCCKWQINGFPCVHAVAAIKRSGKDLNAYVDPYFQASFFRESYAVAIVPIATVGKQNVDVEDVVILPPLTKRPAGRPRNSRVASKGELKRSMKCSRCGISGQHNKRSCKEPI